MDEISAYKQARGSGIPVALPTLPNGTVTVINPGGTQNNFVNAKFAQDYIDNAKKKDEVKHP